MVIAIIGAASFIGKNLYLELCRRSVERVLLVDKSEAFFQDMKSLIRPQDAIVEFDVNTREDYGSLMEGVDLVFHLYSSTVPATSNKNIRLEIANNVMLTADLLMNCVKYKVKRVVFSSSGGAIYGNNVSCPISETVDPCPITTYGWQKLSIEKLLYLFKYQYGLDYRVARIANPYGPYQRPNSGQGAVTTFTYKAINDDSIVIFGDGSTVRDYIYIDDVVSVMCNIALNDCKYEIYNVGSGCGVSLKDLIHTIYEVVGKEAKIQYESKRSTDVQENYLDVSRYENEFGPINKHSLSEGVQKLIEFWRNDND